VKVYRLSSTLLGMIALSGVSQSCGGRSDLEGATFLRPSRLSRVASPRGLTPFWRGARTLLVVSAVLASPRAARCQQSADPRAATKPDVVVIELESGCTTAKEFVEQVRSRAPRVREALSGEPARRVRVTIEGDGRVVGRLVTAGNDGAIVAREVEGATCEEVTAALALVLAVTLDPLTNTRPSDRVSTTALSSEQPPRPVSRSGPPKSGTPRSPAPSDARAHWQHFVGAEATLFAGLVDRLVTGLGARYAVSRQTHGRTTLLLTLGAFATFTADAPANHPAGGVIRYRLQALDAGACPLGAAFLDGRIRLHPCGGMSVGRFQAEGIDVPGSRSDSALFAAASLTGRTTIQLWGPLWLTGAAGLSVPLGKYSVVVVGAEDPAGDVHPIGFIGTLGLVGKLP
jgi:hypothetical protein